MQIPRTLTINGDQTRFIDLISSRNLDRIQSLVAGYELLFVDEAQRIPEIGINLKIILDQIPSLKVLVTSSSALDLASKIIEPLTGRVWNYQLFPISFHELSALRNPAELTDNLEERLVFGSYPEVFSMSGKVEKVEYLRNLSDAYLYRALSNRDDQGKLWENFLMIERMKYMHYSGRLYSPYFWRTYTGAELDYIEEQEGVLSGYKFKYRPKGTTAMPSFQTAYPNSQYKEISLENYLDFIL